MIGYGCILRMQESGVGGGAASRADPPTTQSDIHAFIMSPTRLLFFQKRELRSSSGFAIPLVATKCTSDRLDSLLDFLIERGALRQARRCFCCSIASKSCEMPLFSQSSQYGTGGRATSFRRRLV